MRTLVPGPTLALAVLLAWAHPAHADRKPVDEGGAIAERTGGGDVRAHYARAAKASIAGDLATCAQELRWLSKSSDRTAKQALAKARTDPDFDRATTDDDVRALLGLPAYGTLADDARLVERHGVWSAVNDVAGTSVRMTVVFEKNGDATYSDSLGSKASETWTSDASGTFLQYSAISTDVIIHVTETVQFVTCDGSTVEKSCFLMIDSDGTRHGPFHRGRTE